MPPLSVLDEPSERVARGIQHFLKVYPDFPERLTFGQMMEMRIDTSNLHPVCFITGIDWNLSTYRALAADDIDGLEFCYSRGLYVHDLGNGQVEDLNEEWREQCIALRCDRLQKAGVEMDTILAELARLQR